MMGLDDLLKPIAVLLHGLGLAMCLGGSLSLVVMNMAVGPSPDVALIGHQRLFVSAISGAMTVPGACMLGVGSLAVLGQDRLAGHRWLIATVSTGVLIFLNTVDALAPLSFHLSDLAQRSAGQGQVLEAYGPLKRAEDVFLALNVLLLTGALLLAILRPERYRHAGLPKGPSTPPSSEPR